MKSVHEYRDGSAERIFSTMYAKTVKTLRNVEINGRTADHIDFRVGTDTDGNNYYSIGVVFRDWYDAYYNRKGWSEFIYVVTKEEGNRIYTEAKNNRKLINDVIE